MLRDKSQENVAHITWPLSKSCGLLQKVAYFHSVAFPMINRNYYLLSLNQGYSIKMNQRNKKIELIQVQLNYPGPFFLFSG